MKNIRIENRNIASHGNADVTNLSQPLCPISGSYDSQYLCRVGDFDIWRNKESATDFVFPMPDDGELKNLYDREMWFEGGERGGYADYDAQTEASLHLMDSLINKFQDCSQGLSVLDIGCGYGNHLKIAADKGWNCFGVEKSEHARKIISERHGDRITVTESVEDLLPMRFDLIVLFEVIEHLPDPYKLFFTLFGKNCIGPETLIALSTPNARSRDAIRNPAEWAYRHPPSHLVFYSAKSFGILLERLGFESIEINGIVDLDVQPIEKYPDENFPENDDLSNKLGIYVEARGSHFKEFMHERYVPNSYWKLTEYEHIPRYRMVMGAAANANVLDFGCGTGYGSSLLSRVAREVTGLDISNEAISWATKTHRSSNLSFIESNDLGGGLPSNSFDIVTCFEMIEHVDHDMQRAAVKSISNLLKTDGALYISTPDPRFTAPYGHNPYHLREMTEPQFRELLEECFEHVVILKQWIRPSIYIGRDSVPSSSHVDYRCTAKEGSEDIPIGFVAICSRGKKPDVSDFVLFDNSEDLNLKTLETEHKLNLLRFENYKLRGAKHWHQSQSKSWEQQSDRFSQLNNRLQEIQDLAHEELAWFRSQATAWENESRQIQKNGEIALTWERKQSSAWEVESEIRNIRIKKLELERDELLHSLGKCRTELENAEVKVTAIDRSFILRCLRKIGLFKM